MEMNLTATTSETEAFLKEWFNDNDYVTAQTSGSTGTPKVIHLLKSDMIASAIATNEFFGIDATSRLVCPLSASYIAGKMMIVRALVSRCELHMLQPSNHLELSGRITLLPVVPSQIESLVSEGVSGARIENIIVGGAPMTVSQEQMLGKLPSACYATYGMTETCSHVAVRPVGTPDFVALPGVTFAVDERDCLVINLERFSFNRLVTNDVVTLVGNDRFRWVGRYDNVVNSGGIKLFPEEIESEMASMIKGEFYLGGVPDDKWGERLVMYVTPAPEFAMDRLRDNLPHVKLPKEVRVLHEFPHTSSGKIKRSELNKF